MAAARGRGGGRKKSLSRLHADVERAAIGLGALARGEDTQEAHEGALLAAECMLIVTSYLRGPNG